MKIFVNAATPVTIKGRVKRYFWDIVRLINDLISTQINALKVHMEEFIDVLNIAFGHTLVDSILSTWAILGRWV